MKANHPLILAAIRRARRTYLLLTIIVVPFSLFMAAAPLWSSEGRGITIAATLLGVLFFAVGVGIARLTWQHWQPTEAPVAKTLRDRPGDIAWIYEERIDSKAAGITVAKTHNLKLQLVTGKGHMLNVKGDERDEVLRILGEIAPQATFGYSRELAKQYKRDPRSLVAVS